MNEVFINIKNTTLEKIFNKNLISIEEMYCMIEELQNENEELKEKLETEEEIKNDFYKPKSYKEIYGLSENE